MMKRIILFVIVALIAACTTQTTTPTSIPPDTLTPAPLPQGKTIIITSTSDSGLGSLRQALLDAQPYNTITFDPTVFPPNAPTTIAVMTELPHIQVSNLTLDASNAGVILDGGQVTGEWVAGLQIVSSEANTILGLQISHFPGPAIAISGDAKHNVVGGDRSLGTGSFGHGNMFNDNANGINLSTDGTMLNTITGNLIGTDAIGLDGLGNRRSGISISEGAHGNIIGPDNIIAYNGGCGIEVVGPDSSGNTLTQNSIYDNNEVGICLLGGGTALDVPIIVDFDLAGGFMSGTTCANCRVEIFSDSNDEGAIYEGQVVADSSGVFTFNKGSAFTNTNITSTATDANGNTSGFSRPVGLAIRVVTLQEGNSLPKEHLLTKPSSQLVADTRIAGTGLYSSNIWNDIPNLEYLVNDFIDMGVKRLDTSMQEVEEPIDWNKPEYEIFPEYDQFIDALNENGVAANYMLHFWDKDGLAGGEELSTPRFKSEEQILDFLDYVRFVVSHFKGRIQYYTLWSEPDACGGSGIKCIEPLDYIELARRTIPVIRQEDPQAMVVTGPNVLYFDREYLFTVLGSDVASMFDVISWHGIYDPSPNSEFYGNYYYEYPTIVEEIKQTASANGFEGEYWSTEQTWCSEEFPTCHPPDQPWGMSKTDKIAAKYLARGYVMHLGMDVGVGWGSLESTSQPWTYPTLRILNTIMAGTTPTSLSVDIEKEPTSTVTYAFALPNGDELFALWTDGTAVDDDPGVITTLTFRGLNAGKIVGLDVLYGFEQKLITETENGNLVISNLLIKDYPIIIKLIDTTAP
jgi:hypothetical protein